MMKDNVILALGDTNSLDHMMVLSNKGTLTEIFDGFVMLLVKAGYSLDSVNMHVEVFGEYLKNRRRINNQLNYGPER